MSDIKPLVSVAVITYNSGRYVLETLESIKSQTYENIELIISDDCSSDNTISICKNWLEGNKQRFKRVCLLVADKNTGIPANVNRSVAASEGVWYKGIAGDDILLPDAIEKYIQYICANEVATVVFAKSYAFHETKSHSIVEEPYGDSNSAVFFNNQTAREQYLSFLKDEAKCGGGSPTSFVKRELFITYPLNEAYRGFDDVPEYIKLTKNGIHCNYMDEFTVRYRQGESLTSSRIHFFSPVFWSSKQQYFWNELQYYLKEEGLFDVYNKKRKELLRIELIDLYTKNKVTPLNRIKKAVISGFLRIARFPIN